MRIRQEHSRWLHLREQYWRLRRVHMRALGWVLLWAGGVLLWVGGLLQAEPLMAAGLAVTAGASFIAAGSD